MTKRSIQTVSASRSTLAPRLAILAAVLAAGIAAAAPSHAQVAPQSAEDVSIAAYRHTVQGYSDTRTNPVDQQATAALGPYASWLIYNGFSREVAIARALGIDPAIETAAMTHATVTSAAQVMPGSYAAYRLNLGFSARS